MIKYHMLLLNGTNNSVLDEAFQSAKLNGGGGGGGGLYTWKTECFWHFVSGGGVLFSLASSLGLELLPQKTHLYS